MLSYDRKNEFYGTTISLILYLNVNPSCTIPPTFTGE